MPTAENTERPDRLRNLNRMKTAAFKTRPTNQSTPSVFNTTKKQFHPNKMNIRPYQLLKHYILKFVALMASNQVERGDLHRQ